jgi:retron-type reverse transcriptase
MPSPSHVLNRTFALLDLECSHGFKKIRGTQSFFAYVQSWGEIYRAIKADIVSCFDNINHKGLNKALNEYMDDPQFTNLIHAFLTTDIRDKERKSYAVIDKGIPQGLESPVLMNVFLHQLDCKITDSLTHIRYARYADDLLLAIKPRCPGYLYIVQSKIREFMVQLQLEITMTTFTRGH